MDLNTKTQGELMGFYVIGYGFIYSTPTLYNVVMSNINSKNQERIIVMKCKYLVYCVRVSVSVSAWYSPWSACVGGLGRTEVPSDHRTLSHCQISLDLSYKKLPQMLLAHLVQYLFLFWRRGNVPDS